jgi:hypothetical protein
MRDGYRFRSTYPTGQGLTIQRVCWSGLRVADLLVGCVEVPISRHGSWIHVPSDVRCCALQGDGIACSLVFWASEFLASTGDVSEPRATVAKAKIGWLIRMGLSFLEKD